VVITNQLKAIKVSCTTLVLSDWDADGVVSAALIIYSQEYLGAYPLKQKCAVHLIPVGSKGPDSSIIEEVSGQRFECLVMLDQAFNDRVERFLTSVRETVRYIVYIDHHLSSMIYAPKVEKLVDEALIGRSPTAVLLFDLLRALNIRVTDRLESFVGAITVLERSNRKWPQKPSKKLVDLAASISRTLSRNRDRNLWEKIIRWMASPSPFIASPFTQSLTEMVEERDPKEETELKALASELLLSSKRVYGMRVIDARRVDLKYKPSSIIRHVMHLSKTPVILIFKDEDGRDVVAVRSDDDFPYFFAAELVKRELVEEVGGHYNYAVLFFKAEVNLEDVINVIKDVYLKLVKSYGREE